MINVSHQPITFETDVCVYRRLSSLFSRDVSQTGLPSELLIKYQYTANSNPMVVRGLVLLKILK